MDHLDGLNQFPQDGAQEVQEVTEAEAPEAVGHQVKLL